ncbi:hypothetical protein CFC21_027013 [Triticum aestivum]|uniref:C2H2-type domain-containing protein n=3 Tax=Triticinae TaxID=1648030 RepID=A0A3B6D3P1_WHEAT|nr:uncharacterized protein LOC123050939 [Triticum aestivum]KAF7012864.1 hypothetical protein CFC21_027013 [Triticum aestivum]
MALSALLLPSSSTTTADTSDRRRGQQPQPPPQQQNHHSKRKKKPPSLPPPLSPAPRTPGRRHLAATGTPSRKSPALAAPTAGAKARLVAGKDHRQRRSGSKKAAAQKPARPASSWEQLKSLLSCRSATAAARVHDPAALARGPGAGGYWGTSLCSMRDVATVDGASSAASVVVDHRDTAPLNRSSRRAHHSSSSSAGGGGHPSSLRGLSGCYECRAINVEPVSRRYPRPRELCPCSQCGEVFTKADSLEQHQAVRHAVSELGPEDSGRNIVEIIFKSSWQKRDRPICHIDRILKVRNPPRTVARFEAYRDAVRARCRADAAGAGGATRAAADGNELLRFHPAALACELGADGSTSLCASCDDGDADGKSAAAACGVCAAIRHGFAPWAGAHPLGVRTTASSGRAHDVCGAEGPSAAAPGWRAMLVCRVIAGQVRRRDGDGEEGKEEAGPFDSVAGDDAGGAYGVLEELFVANPRAILPCFVVVYRVDVDAQ